MTRKILVFVVLGLLAYGLPAAQVDPQIAREVATAFDQAAKEHVAGVTQTMTPQQTPQLEPPEQPKFTPWSLHCMDMEAQSLNYSAAMEGLVKRVKVLDDAGKIEKVAEYCRAAVPFLTATPATHKALACEFLAHFPASAVEAGAIPGIGALLDDTTEAFHGMRGSMQQSAMTPGTYTPISMTVADMAQIALLSTTYCHFSSQEIFQRWWAGNNEYASRLWYWISRYRDTPEIRTQLAKLNPTQTLKVYLLLNNSAARRNEREAPWRDAGLQQPPDLDGGIYFHNAYSPVQAGKFVAAHHLQPVLLDLLAGTTTWPEVKDNTGSGETELAMMIAEVGRNCWTRKDATTIEQILNSGRGLAVHETRVQTQLTGVAVNLDSARLEPILLGQLARNPLQPDLTTILLANTNLKHWDVIRGYYARFDGFGQSQVIRTLGDMAIREDMRTALCQLFAEDHLDAALTPNGNVADEDSPRRVRLDAYASAAERINGGQPAVDPAVLRAALSCGRGKVDRKTSEAELAAMPPARTEAIKQLTAFFAKVKPVG